MPRSSSDRDFDELSVSEKIVRVQDLWDEIADSPSDVQLTDAQKLEIERRLRAHEENPGEYRSWDEIRQSLMVSR